MESTHRILIERPIIQSAIYIIRPAKWYFIAHRLLIRELWPTFRMQHEWGSEGVLYIWMLSSSYKNMGGGGGENITCKL